MGGVAPPAPIRAPEPIGPVHLVDDFTCGDRFLDDWLKTRALKSEGRFARTYVACVGNAVVGYDCIATGSVERQAAPGRLRRNAPDPVPIAIIGRLAVDRNHAGRGLGADLLGDAFRRIAAASQIIGLGAVIVHAKDDAALAFYRKQAEFLEYPAGSRALYLPIATLIDAS